jgi:hypothetical protein
MGAVETSELFITPQRNLRFSFRKELKARYKSIFFVALALLAFILFSNFTFGPFRLALLFFQVAGVLLAAYYSMFLLVKLWLWRFHA